MGELVSIIITTYRGNNNLVRAIESAQQQDYPSIEIIVVDDNDPDTEARKITEELINAYSNTTPKFPVNYIKHSHNMNGATARNTGVANCKGKYIQLLDDDDVLFPSKISKSVKAIEESGLDGVLTRVACCSGSNIVSISGSCASIGLADKRAELMVVPDFLGTGSNIFVRTDAYRELDGFDTSFLRMQDLEFMMRFFRKHKCAMLDEILIIKADNDRKIVYTDYQRQIGFKQRFWDKFMSDLKESMTEKQYYDYFNLEYTHLFRIALMNRSKTDLNEAVKNLQGIRPLSKKESLFVKMHSAYVVLHKSRFLVEWVRSLRYKGEKAPSEIVAISKEVRNYITSIIGE